MTNGRQQRWRTVTLCRCALVRQPDRHTPNETLNMVRMKKTRLALTIVLVAGLAACGTTHTVAPVVERASVPRPAPAPKPRPVENGSGYYTVKKGDTVNRIAQEFNQSFRDIVIWNGLTSPNDIKVDQVLRVAPPEGPGAPAPGAAQTGSIATSSGVEVRPLGAPAAAPAANANPIAAPAANGAH